MKRFRMPKYDWIDVDGVEIGYRPPQVRMSVSAFKIMRAPAGYPIIATQAKPVLRGELIRFGKTWFFENNGEPVPGDIAARAERELMQHHVP